MFPDAKAVASGIPHILTGCWPLALCVAVGHTVGHTDGCISLHPLEGHKSDYVVLLKTRTPIRCELYFYTKFPFLSSFSSKGALEYGASISPWEGQF